MKREYEAKSAVEFQSRMKRGKLTIPKKEQENYKVRISSFNKKSTGKKTEREALPR